MAVATETAAWRAAEPLDVKRKRAAWGADAQQLMHMMMGQVHSAPTVRSPATEFITTLDLLGKASDPCPSSSPQLDLSVSLDLEEPLPSGWEKCLDLKTGKVSYVNKTTGVSTFNDPRKKDIVSPLAAHEFLSSKRSETLRHENTTPASSSGSPNLNSSQALFPFSTGKQLTWTVDHRHVASSATRCEEFEPEEESVLELDLNLAAGGCSSSPPRPANQAVCTMEMIQNALKRTAEKASPMVPRLQHKLSVSSSFSSRSEPIDSGVAPSPSTSSSSSTSSRSRRAVPLNETRQSTGACEGDSKVDSGALVMGACTRCLMYVMLKKFDPRCPRCESAVPVDFSAPPCKRHRVVSDRRR